LVAGPILSGHRPTLSLFAQRPAIYVIVLLSRRDALMSEEDRYILDVPCARSFSTTSGDGGFGLAPKRIPHLLPRVRIPSPAPTDTGSRPDR
jgi:hypothetical protein